MTREESELSEERHYAQFDPEPITGEPDVPVNQAGIASMQQAEDELLAEFFPDPKERAEAKAFQDKMNSLELEYLHLIEEPQNLTTRAAGAATRERP